MKVVFDTNILISAFVFPGGIPEQILNLASLNEFALCLSPDIFSEFKKVLQKKFKYSEEEIHEFLDYLRGISKMIYPIERIELIQRVDADNRILECAVETQAQFLITGDKRDLLPLQKIGKTKIITASQFLSYLRNRK